MMENQNLTENEEKVIHGIQALMHANLSTAIDNAMKNLPDCRPEIIVPIALSRLVCRELMILSVSTLDVTIEKWRDLFVALLNDLVANKIDMLKLKMQPQKDTSNADK